jgi:hypothetical protein
MKNCYLKYIDGIEKIVEKIKGLDVDEPILDLYSELTMPTTQQKVLQLVNAVLNQIKSSKCSKELFAQASQICEDFSNELKKDRRFDSKKTVTDPDEEIDDDEDEEQEPEKKSNKSQTKQTNDEEVQSSYTQKLTSDIDDLL